MCDKLVFDLAQEIEATPTVFVRKDWINILDNQNQNYNNNQSVIDTSQLSNSNKYMGYREAYLNVPFLITLGQTNWSATPANNIDPTDADKSLDYSVGLKNWFGQIIHSFTLDYNGTTIIQQTPFVNMWNSFKLMTSLSWQDVETQGATIGFYPDDPTTWSFVKPTAAADSTTSALGMGVCNNSNYLTYATTVKGRFNNYNSESGNKGFLRRQQLINFDISGVPSTGTYADLITTDSTKELWKSYISSRSSGTGVTNSAYIQYSINATIYLKHLHSFFAMCPLIKGAFMKITMNLNNTSTNLTTAVGKLSVTGVSNSLGGVNPIMVASATASPLTVETTLGGTIPTGLTVDTTVTGGETATNIYNGGYPLITEGSATNFIVNLSVGKTCLDQTLSSTIGNSTTGTLSQSIYLYVPAYTFNPVFEQAYISSPIKEIRYTDIYQYQILNVSPGGQINNLLTNGIANLKSVLIVPFYSSTAPTSGTFNTNSISVSSTTGIIQGMPVWQSPFDPAGTGPTSPLCHITNFNIQVSGQNAIYNLQKYGFEQFNNQLYGQNAVNGGLTDGLTSSLIDRTAFDMEYCYYYVNVERMLPVEQSVPKSVQVTGKNLSAKAIDYICFIEYGQSISLDLISGSRV